MLALAQTGERFECVYGDVVRRVEIVYESGVTVPCEVHYYKDTEAPGQREILWRADSQLGYCEQQTEAFISQLRGWGWRCVDFAAGPATDDTDTLEAGAP
jgi:hypothetical protein